MQKETYIWGAGHYGVLTALDLEREGIKVSGFIDYNANEIKTRLGLPVLVPFDVIKSNNLCLRIIVAIQNEVAIEEISEILRNYEIDFEISNICIKYQKELVDTYVRCQKELEIKNYFLSLSENVNDPEIIEIVNFFKKGYGFTIFPYEFSRKYHTRDIDIFWDNKDNMRYVQHKNKRLYFPEKWSAEQVRNYYNSIRVEQDKDSSHRYETHEFTVQEGDIITDIGAAEGIWALNYVENAEKIYLFERNLTWIKALLKTFEPWKEKVVIINKCVSDIDDSKNVTLDNFFGNERVDFIKADIEGMEIKLLEGCKGMLVHNSNLKLLLCAYHKKGDGAKIKEILEKNDFKTEFSKGYMLFSYDKELEKPYYRRGLVRAVKEHIKNNSQISIITCSINPDICQRMFNSINETIGVEYEAIAFDNREKKYGICKAYNEAAKEAKGNYLCFVHEDIVIKTNDWGKELIKFANQNNDCGVIGIAGTKWACRNFFGWWSSDNKLVKVFDGTGSDKRNNFIEKDLIYKYINPDNEIFSKAICLDGVFLFVKKEIWDNNKFDEEIFKDFHFYDADFTFSISQKYQNYVYFGMDIKHFSKGNIEKTFCESMYLFQKKWKNILPYCLSGYKVSFQKELQKANEIFSLYKKNGFSEIENLKRVYKINGIKFLIFFLLQLSKTIRNSFLYYITMKYLNEEFNDDICIIGIDCDINSIGHIFAANHNETIFVTNSEMYLHGLITRGDFFKKATISKNAGELLNKNFKKIEINISEEIDHVHIKSMASEIFDNIPVIKRIPVTSNGKLLYVISRYKNKSLKLRKDS